ncbi:MAG: DUF58 domain-containing protein [Deltaproteobacteria bacterium]|nr:DUF58 domain-containing protein [Deltaproteobacteria bacterium]
MKQQLKKNGIWLGKMELPDLIQLASKKVTSASPKNASTLGGPYLTKLKGRGMEFAEARPYQPGDDVRHIDWRVTARTGRTHTKLFREERERPVMLVLDQAQQMFFGSRERLKSVQAARIAALLGWRALLRGDRVGGVLFSEQMHREFRPRVDRRHYLRLLSNIMTEHNLVVDRMNEGEWSFSSNILFAEALRRVRQVVQPGSLVYVFSDFAGFDAECKKHLFQLSKQNQVQAYLITDPLEKDTPTSGRYAMSDGKTTAWVNAGNSKTRQIYTNTFEQHQERVASELRLCRVSLNILSTVDNVSAV